MNIEKLKRLERRLRRIRHEEHYNQKFWAAATVCGTAACIAGHTVLMEGGKFDLPTLKQTKASGAGPGEIVSHVSSCTLPGEDGSCSILDAAQQILGLSESEADLLFFSDPDGYWPDPFAQRWSDAMRGMSKERPSRIAADFVKAIIEGKVDHWAWNL